MADTPLQFKRPNAISLARVRDRLSFLYLDKCAVIQDDNGTLARVGIDTNRERTVYLPTATLASLMLGPGTSLTQPAAAALARMGCSVSFVGSGAVRSYSTFSPLAVSTRLLDRQARVVVDDEERTAAAIRMYTKRYPDAFLDVFPEDLTIEQLRGMEGVRMRASYQLESSRRRLKGWRRNDGKLGPLDPANEALNHANTALYGVVNAVVQGLGMSPGLGIVHHGQRSAFVLDIADLYKTEVTIPLAFSLWKSTNAGRDAMIALRASFTLLKLVPRIVDDIYYVLDLDQAEREDKWKVEELFLWSPEGSVESGPNHASLPFVGDD